jgi:hypothetical protein
MTNLADLVPFEKQIKISRANRAGVPLQRIADYLGLTVAQVEAVVALDQEFRKEEREFAAWIDANKGK